MESNKQCANENNKNNVNNGGNRIKSQEPRTKNQDHINNV